MSRSTSRWLSCELSKSFCEFASVGADGVYGNGTSDVSWFTYRSSLFLSLVRNEIPSGIDSYR